MNICLTGASRGLGKALAAELLQSGHRVWGVARTLDGASPSTDGRSFHSVVDITRTTDRTAWYEAMARADFTPDAVILNASIQEPDMEDGLDALAVRRVLETNLLSALACTAELLQPMRERGHGTFLAIASTAALRPSLRSASYSASKAGIAMAFRTLHLRYRSEGIRFKTVFLGPVATTLWEGKRHWMVPSPERAAAAIARFLPSARSTLFYPRLSTTLLRMSLLLPDAVFHSVSATLLH